MQVSILFDEFGQIISVNRPSRAGRVVVLGGKGQSILVTDIDEADVKNVMATHRVDINKKRLIPTGQK
jgi:hypothetical protein